MFYMNSFYKRGDCMHVTMKKKCIKYRVFKHINYIKKNNKIIIFFKDRQMYSLQYKNDVVNM